MSDDVARRTELIVSDPFAALINTFLISGLDSQEVIDTGSGKAYGRLYAAAKHGRWLKRSVWIRKEGSSTFLYRTEEAWLAAKEAAKNAKR